MIVEGIIMLAIVIVAFIWDVKNRRRIEKEEEIKKEKLRKKVERGLRENGSINMARK